MRLERELCDAQQQLAQATYNPEDFTANLVQSRSYAVNPSSGTQAKVVDECVDSLHRYGFCVVDNVIPANKVSVIRQEVIQAQTTISQNLKKIREEVDNVGLNPSKLLTGTEAELRPVRRVGHLPKPPAGTPAQAAQRHCVDASVCSVSGSPGDYSTGPPSTG